MRNFFSTKPKLEAKPIPHSGPTEPQPDPEEDSELNSDLSQEDKGSSES